MERMYTVPATGQTFLQSDYNRTVEEYRTGMSMVTIAKRYAQFKGISQKDAFEAVTFIIYRYHMMIRVYTR